MIEQLNTITSCIEEYEASNLIHLDRMNELLKVLTSNLYYLESERSRYHDNFQKIIHKLTKEGKSVSRAENEAHVQVPEMYLLRRSLDAAYRVADAIRTNISYYKNEKRNS